MPSLDWPALVIAAVVAAAFLWRGRVGRAEGAVLVALGLAFAVLHITRWALAGTVAALVS